MRLTEPQNAVVMQLKIPIVVVKAPYGGVNTAGDIGYEARDSPAIILAAAACTTGSEAHLLVSLGSCRLVSGVGSAIISWPSSGFSELLKRGKVVPSVIAAIGTKSFMW